MNIIIDSATLRTACANAAKNLPGRNGLPILSCFLFETTDEYLRVTSCDGDNRSSYCVPANVTVMDGNHQDFCIEAATIMKFLVELPSQPIGIDVKGMECTIRYQNGKANVPLFDSKEFPREVGQDTKAVKLPMLMLRDIIANHLFAVAEDELRPTMNGVCFDFREKDLVTVSTDQSRLCRYPHPGVEWERGAYIVAKRGVMLMSVLLEHHAKRLSKGEDGNVTLAFSAKNVDVYMDKDKLSLRLINGDYPKYDNVIPKQSPYRLEVNRVELISAVRRVMVALSVNVPLIKLSAYYNRLELLVDNIYFASSAEEKISCRWNGGECFQIGFDGIYLLEILNHLDTEDVCIELTNEKTAGVFRGVGDEKEVLMLLMPKMINS